DISPLLVAPAVAKNSQKPKDEKVDVVVIGSGIAGLTSAIAAHEGGAKVLVLEKQGMLGAGDSMNISTGITAGGTKLIKEKGIQGKTTQDYVDLLMKQAKDKNVPINKENVETYARRGGEVIDWLMDLGVPFGRFQEDKYFHIIKDGSAPGPYIIKALSKEVKKDNIPYRLNSKVVEILSDNGRASGVKVSTPDGDYKVLAKAVIVATGG
ncbi:FAD-dependent oxidoreductase, partial [Turicimonas muris]|uniref:FAD-dependent oxidoreductase n=1 Tax=Turicimonas muris TaxID=1796652 RepID=UPI003EC0C476